MKPLEVVEKVQDTCLVAEGDKLTNPIKTDKGREFLKSFLVGKDKKSVHFLTDPI